MNIQEFFHFRPLGHFWQIKWVTWGLIWKRFVKLISNLPHVHIGLVLRNGSILFIKASICHTHLTPIVTGFDAVSGDCAITDVLFQLYSETCL